MSIADNQAELKKNIAKYLMCEYPSHLEHEWGEHDDFPYKEDDNNRKKRNIRIIDFYKTRKRYIKVTTGIYFIEILLYIPQLCILSVRAFTETHNWWMLALKLLGFILCFSVTVWVKQLWKDEEYYGLALANYSKDEPIDRTLNKLFYPGYLNNQTEERKRRDRHEIVITMISDWLKNRPSVTFLLIASICCYRLDYTLVFVFKKLNDFLAGSIPFSPLRSFVIQFAIGLLFFAFHLPCFTRSGSKYIKIMLPESKKHPVFNRIAYSLWFILFFLPVLINFLLSPDVLRFVTLRLPPQSIVSVLSVLLPIILAFSLSVLLLEPIKFILASISIVFYRWNIPKKGSGNLQGTADQKPGKNAEDTAPNNNDASHNHSPSDFREHKLFVVLFSFAVLLFVSLLYVFFLPAIAAFHAPDELAAAYDHLCVLALVGLGISVYGLLYFLSKNEKKKTDHEDEKHIKAVCISLETEAINESEIRKNFSYLSPRGQMQVLTMIQNRDICIKSDNYLDFLSALADTAHTPLALDSILDIYRSHEYADDIHSIN